MKKMYGLSSGEYSSYGVIAVCPTREVAEALAAKINRRRQTSYDEVSVEEFDYYDSPDDVVTWVQYVVEVDETGSEMRRHSIAHWSRATGAAAEDFAYWNERSTYRRVASALGVSRRGYDAALKAARDRLAQAKAEQEGVA